MYRQYENPTELQCALDNLQAQFDDLVASGKVDDDTYYDLRARICDLQDRINFAWQDIEYEEAQA